MCIKFYIYAKFDGTRTSFNSGVAALSHTCLRFTVTQVHSDKRPAGAVGRKPQPSTVYPLHALASVNSAEEFLNYNTHEKTTLRSVWTAERLRAEQQRIGEYRPLVANNPLQSVVAQRQTENEMMRETHAEEVSEWPTSPRALPVDGH